MGMQGCVINRHIVDDVIRHVTPHVTLVARVDFPVDWLVLAVQHNSVENIKFATVEQNSKDFMSLANTEDWECFVLNVFQILGVLQNFACRFKIWMNIA